MNKGSKLTVTLIIFLTAVLTILTLSSMINRTITTTASDEEFTQPASDEEFTYDLETLKYDLETLKEKVKNSPDECWKKPAQNRKNTTCNKIDELQALINQEDFEGAYDKLLHDIKPKLTGLKTNELEEPWGNGVFKQPWVICPDLQLGFRDECNLILSEINPQSVYDDDKTPPIITIDYVGENLDINPGVWNVYIEDPEEGLNYVEIFVDGIVEVQDILGGDTIISYLDIDVPSAAGDHIIEIFAENIDGYSNQDIDIATINDDDPTEPTILIIYVGSGTDFDPGWWYVHVEDLESGLAQIRVTINEVEYLNHKNLGGIQSRTYPEIGVPIFPGTHTIEVWAWNYDSDFEGDEESNYSMDSVIIIHYPNLPQ